MKISVCVIVLNEEKVIERLLKCVDKFADEIIVVDTGSVDETVKICKKYSSKVYSFKWINDFSAARNFAISKATCDYIMWLDADDIITDDNIKKIITLKEDESCADTYMCKYSCGFDKYGNSSLEFYRERIIKNCSYAKFKGFIHEVIIPFGKIEYTDINVEHRKIVSGNPFRNLKIYRYHLKNGEVFSQRDVYYMAKEYFYLGFYKSAERYLNKFIKYKNAYEPDLSDAYLTLFDCALKTSKENPQNYLFKSIEKCGPNSEVFCKIGDYYFNRKEYGLAITYYKCALCCIKPSVGFVKSVYYYLYPNLQLVVAYYNIGDINKSKEYHLKCVNENSNNEAVINNDIFFNSLNLIDNRPK